MTLRELIDEAKQKQELATEMGFGEILLSFSLAAKAEEMAKMLDEMAYLTDCHCNPCWTDRQLHAPECHADETPDVRGFLRAEGML